MPVPLAQITIDDFRPLLGEAFTLHAAGHGAAAMRLVEVRSLGRHSPAGRESFSLLWHAPAALRQLPQGIHPVEHPALGCLELFVVPVGLDAAGLSIEAVFNFS